MLSVRKEWLMCLLQQPKGPAKDAGPRRENDIPYVQARSSKSPSLAPARNSRHSALVYVVTGPSGWLVLPSSTKSPRRATITHAPLSHVRETRHGISPAADGSTDTRLSSH